MSDEGRRFLSNLHNLVTQLLEETSKARLRDADHAKEAKREGKTEHITVTSL